MKLILGVMILLVIGGAVCFAAIPEFNQMVRALIVPKDTEDEPKLRADFQPSTSAGTAPLSVRFVDNSGGVRSASVTRLWDFGDDTTSTDPSPTHAFTTPGSYGVKLTLRKGAEESNASKTITVSEPKIADFTAAVTRGVNSLEVRFKDTSTITGTDWTWSFGDGATHAAQNPKHRYSWPDESPAADAQVHKFDVTLRVDGPGGPLTKTKRGFITLYRPVQVKSIAVKTRFNKVARTGVPVRFTCSVTGAPASYRWDFGDGRTKAGVAGRGGEEAVHHYKRAGTFTVTVTAKGELPSNAATGTTEVVVLESVRVPRVYRRTVKEATALLKRAGLKVAVMGRANAYVPVARAAQKLEKTPKIVSRFRHGLDNRVVVHEPNPAWPAANAAYQQAKAAYDRASATWRVSGFQLVDGSSLKANDVPTLYSDHHVYVAKGSVIYLRFSSKK